MEKLEFAESPSDIRASMEEFNGDFIHHQTTTLNLLRRWQYWVYDPSNDKFSPSKFCGFKHMTFDRYEDATARKKKLKAEGKLAGSDVVCFDGTHTREKIEKITGFKFKSDPELTYKLIAWAKQSFRGTDIYNIDEWAKKWEFLRLPSHI